MSGGAARSRRSGGRPRRLAWAAVVFHRPSALIGCAAILVAACSAEDDPVGADPSAAPTFTRDVAPIVFQSCAACHRPGEAAPFPLLSYRDVQKRAKQIVIVTEQRYMPPWPPVPGHGEFSDGRRLEDVIVVRS